MRGATPSSAIAALALLGCLAGCTSFLPRAKHDYDHGLYLRTAEELAQREDELPYLMPDEQVDYGLYRGLALMKLGDALNAHRWLAFALSVDKENPGAMRSDQRVVIERAFVALNEGTGRPHEVRVQPPLR